MKAQIGDDVTVVLSGRLTAYDGELGEWTLRGSAPGHGHVAWEWPLHWATEFRTTQWPPYPLPSPAVGECGWRPCNEPMHVNGEVVGYCERPVNPLRKNPKKRHHKGPHRIEWAD